VQNHGLKHRTINIGRCIDVPVEKSPLHRVSCQRRLKIDPLSTDIVGVKLTPLTC
jgi:hypothetical protein